MAASPVSLPSFPGHSQQSSPSASSNRSNSLPSPTILNRMISQSAKPSHTCPSCSRPFSRAEHLDRHLTTHLPINSSKSFICPSCGKGFTRKDVLTRHVRAVHETKRSDVRRSRRRSCRRCAGFKIKCSGGARGSADGSRGDEACEACKKRGVMCVYDFGTHTDGSAAKEDTGKNSGTGSGDDDLDYVSEEDGPGGTKTDERVSKRRKISDAYSDHGNSPIASNVSHLLSAAMMASPTSPQRLSGDIGMDDESFTAAATVASLVNSATTNRQRTPDTISAEHLMSMVTEKTYEDFAGKVVSPRSMYRNGDKPSYFSQSRFSTISGSVTPPSHSSTTEFRHNTSRDPTLSRASLNPSQFVAALTQQSKSNAPSLLYPGNSSPSLSTGIGVRRPEDSFNHVRCSDSTLANVCLGSTSGMPGVLPPPTFSVAGDVGTSPKLFSNVLLSSGDSRREDLVGDSVHLESDDNWFFDAGIFETDWLRWGGFSSEPLTAPELEQIPSSIALSERHMSTCSNASVSGNVPSLTNSRTTSGTTSKDFCSPASTPSEYSAYPPNSKEVRLPSVSPIKDNPAIEDLLPWGWQATREEPKRRITLPPLRQVLEECSTKRHERSTTTFSPRFTSAESNMSTIRIGSVSDNIRNDLISVLKVPYARHPYYDDCDIEHKFPSKELIDGFIVLYFKHFHSILPMIHKPTFKVENCPSILLVAMASIGASYSDIEGAKGFADGLSELCKRALTWMAEYDNGYLRSEYYLTAFCLQHAYALGSGHQALYDAADSTRSFLVANARRCGLFSDKTSPCTRPSSVPSSPRGNTTNSDESPQSRGCILNPSGDEQQLHARWLSWTEQEKRKRVAWAIFSYDSSFSTLSNRRGDISLNDIKSRLPCEEKMWEAPTAEAWAAMLPPPTASNVSLAYRGMPFFPTLRDVIAGKLDPKEIPSWGKELCAWALGRMLWDFKEMEQTAQGCGVNGVSGLGLPVLTEGLKQTKETALAALTALGEAAWRNDGGECDKVHSNLTSLIAHYSHLHFGVPTISLILSLARNPPPSPCMTKCPTETIEDARITRLRSIFTDNPVHARTIAWHAGQIIGISRYRPVHTPAETMRVFLAGVVLWGVAKWFVECRSMAAANTWTCGLNDGVDIRLDAIPMPSSGNSESCGMPTVVAEWLKTGKGRATIRKDGDDAETGETQLCSERGAKEVLQVVVGILGKMRIWGLGAEFRRILEVMGK